MTTLLTFMIGAPTVFIGYGLATKNQAAIGLGSVFLMAGMVCLFVSFLVCP